MKRVGDALPINDDDECSDCGLSIENAHDNECEECCGRTDCDCVDEYDPT